MTNQYSDLNINLTDLILSYKPLELNQKYLKNESFGFKFNRMHKTVSPGLSGI